jgi:hypothetical protein
LYVLLERAWWLGEIHGDERFDRLQLLKHMFKKTRSDDPGIVFIVCGETTPPEEKALPDGGVEVDLRPRVPLPSIDTNAWDTANCKEAFDALAGALAHASSQISSAKSYRLVAPILISIKLTRSEFIRWVKVNGYDEPSFWAAGRRGRPAAGAGKRKSGTGKRPLVIEWLQKRFGGEPVPEPSHAPRKALIAEAIKALPALGGSLDAGTMKRAIDEYDAAVGHDPK